MTEIPTTTKEFDRWIAEHKAELTPAMESAARVARNCLWQREANAKTWAKLPQSVKELIADSIAAFWRLWLERNRDSH
jgi:cell wall assembly regulator SMI1